MKAPWSMMPLLPVTAAVALGIFLAEVSSGLWIAAGAVIVAAGLAAVGRVPLLSMGLMCLVVGTLLGDMAQPVPNPCPDGKSHTVSGVVERVCETDYGYRLTLLIDSIEGHATQPFSCAASVMSQQKHIDLCDRLRLTTKLEDLQHQTDLPDELDYALLLERRGVTATTILSPADILSVTPEPGVLNGLRRLQPRMESIIADTDVSYPTLQFLNATLLGDASALDEDTRTDFAHAGLAHMLALSGLHVGLIVVIVGLVLWPLKLAGLRRTYYAMLLLSMWAYACITGLSPSVARAVIMYTAVVLAAILSRRYSAVNALCLAALLILIVTPRALFAIGFRLSFLATLSILVLTPKLAPEGNRWYSLPLKGISATLAAMAGVGVLSLSEFHTFPVYFLIANVLTAPLLALAMLSGALCAILQGIGIHWMWGVSAVDFLCGLIMRIASEVGRWPGAVIDDVYLLPGVDLLLFGGISGLLLWSLWYRRRRMIAYLSVGLLVAGVAIQSAAPVMAEDTIYFTNRALRTDILVHRSPNLYLITTARGGNRQEALDDARRRYATFCRRRGIADITILPDTFDLNHFSRKGSELHLDGRTYWLDHSGVLPADSLHIDYLVLCRGRKMRLERILRLCRPDSVLLSSDLGHRRTERFKQRLRELEIPYRQLRE